MSIRSALIAHHHQLRRVLPQGYRRYRVPGGRIYLDVRESPLMLARVLGVYEPLKMRAFREHVRPGMTVADVGANKGDFTLLAARLVGPAGRAIAVEPAPDNYQWLTRTVAESGYRNIECVPAALGASPGRAMLCLAAQSGMHSLLPGNGDTVPVELRTLDSLGPLDAVKIDVEGFEEEVLAGGQRTLASRLRAVFLDLHPGRGVNVDRILGMLEAAGFSVACRGCGNDVLAIR